MNPGHQAAVTSSVWCPRPSGRPAVRCFLFHHAGGSHLAYQEWLAHMPAGWQLCFVEAPGRGRLADIPVRQSIGDLVTFLLDDLVHWLDRPFVFFGHSMGALVAYELTQRMRACGLPLPFWLGLSGHGLPRPGARPWRRHLMTRDELRDNVRDMGGTPPHILADAEWWALLEPLFRTDLRMVETWRPDDTASPIPVPLSTFGGRDDPVAGRADLLAWAGRTERFLGLRLFSGGHFYFRARVGEVAAHIGAEARTAWPDGPDQAPPW